MRDLFTEIVSLIRAFSILDLIDVLLVAFIIYKILMLIRGTRAWRVVGGSFVFIVLLIVSKYLRLTLLHSLLQGAVVFLPVALAILLLPELRQLLEGMTRLPSFPLAPDETTEIRTIEEIVASVAELSAGRVGALIVIERQQNLKEIAMTGVTLNARVSAPLLGSIFYEGNPLHDGAAIIRGDNLLAAACRLPLSESRRVEPNLHMRHRAALGASETLDCLTIVVSEERGTISIAQQGAITKLAGPSELRELLHREIRGEGPPRRSKPLISFRSKETAKQ